MYAEEVDFVENVVRRLSSDDQRRLLAKVMKSAKIAENEAKYTFFRTFRAVPGGEYEQGWWTAIFFGLEMGTRELPRRLTLDAMPKTVQKALVRASVEAVFSCGVRIGGQLQRKRWPVSEKSRFRLKIARKRAS